MEPGAGPCSRRGGPGAYCCSRNVEPGAYHCSRRGGLGAGPCSRTGGPGTFPGSRVSIGQFLRAFCKYDIWGEKNLLVLPWILKLIVDMVNDSTPLILLLFNVQSFIASPG